ncbi:MAG: hypothetical protein V7618_11585 [Rhodoglobus sp.]
MTTLWPVFPKTVGDYVEFEKDGRWYRMLKHADDLWIIHQRGVASTDFELLVTNRRNGLMDVVGRGNLGSISALGVSEGLHFDKLF